MAEPIEIKKLGDILNLDDEQFARFLPDFVAWRNASRCYLSMLGAKFDANPQAGPMPEHDVSILWTDDGDIGRVTDLHITIGDEVLTAKQGEQQ